ncbi:hypothetical protein [Brevibacillus sp. H7]|uniref:hypothetical protein n=1 Tax=Brevibacillus sp. H7 TaxID=3349138 RepID=UPI00381D0158
MENLLFDLLEVAIVLIGKFWFVILGYIGYKLFGGLGKRAGKGVSQGKPRQVVLTPVEGGGFPRWEQRSKPEEVSERMDSNEAKAAWTETEDGNLNAAEPSTRGEFLVSDPDPEEKKDALDLDLDPREGLKWAIIYGPPRAKAPYAPSYLSRKRNA